METTTVLDTTTAGARKAGGTITFHISQAQERAKHLDRLADSELAVGRHAAAERLSNIAHELREVSP